MWLPKVVVDEMWVERREKCWEALALAFVEEEDNTTIVAAE